MSEAPPPTEPNRPHGLPEVQWTFRRLYTYGLTLICLGLLAGIIHLLRTEPEPLLRIAYCLVGIIVLQQLFYTGGATLTDVWRLVSAVRNNRSDPR
jgi:hypothetical protein